MTLEPRPRPSRRPRGRRPAPRDAGPALSAGQRDELWAAYVADRGNLQLRDRLVEHYLPWVAGMAAALARKLRLRDQENAVAEVLAALVESIVPSYDGKQGFRRWARTCAKHKLIDLRRAEQRHHALFPQLPSKIQNEALENLPDHRDCGGERTFGRITAELTDRQAAVLWLREYFGLSVEAAAPLLKLSPRSVKTWTRSALEALKEN